MIKIDLTKKSPDPTEKEKESREFFVKLYADYKENKITLNQMRRYFPQKIRE